MAQGSGEQKLSFSWRFAGLWMVVFAIGLAVLGIALAVRQAIVVEPRFVSEAEARAHKVAAEARLAFQDLIDRSLRDLAQRYRESPGAFEKSVARWPDWSDGVYLWELGGARMLNAPAGRPHDLKQLIEARMLIRELDRAPLPATSGFDLLYDSLGKEAVVLACMELFGPSGRPATLVARVDLTRIKNALLVPLVSSSPGLEIVPLGEADRPRATPLELALRFWAVQPTRAFLEQQTDALLGQTLAYVGLTLLALITLLAAIWFLVRLARREMSLAQTKADFVANVSHELKTPLALIRMFAETLESGRVTSPEKRNEYYAVIARESTRLAGLIDNILDFARIDAGRKQYRLARVNLGQVVRETYDSYTPQLEADGFEHSLSIADDLPPVSADPGAISQVVVNLVGNAMKYSEDDKYIGIELTIDTRRNRRGVLLSVHDRGIGISPEDRRHLFEGFFRADNEVVRRRKGTGLGLALVKHIVEAHDASLSVESRLVKGTTFRVFFPSVEDASGANSDGSGREAADNLATVRSGTDQGGKAGDSGEARENR